MVRGPFESQEEAAMRTIRFAAIFSLMVLCGGCATTGEPTAVAPAASQGDASRIDRDAQYMARVEHEARKRGIGVTWVNPPTRRAAPATP